VPVARFLRLRCNKVHVATPRLVVRTGKTLRNSGTW
jgi:hypothetical protein